MMYRIFTAALLSLVFCGSAFAQGSANCKVTTAAPSGYTDGTTKPLSCDTSGNLRSTGSGGGGGGPVDSTTTMSSITVLVANTYQQALASAPARKGCTVQYVTVAGTKGFVFFGAAPGSTATSFQLANGQSISCQSASVIASDAVQVTANGIGDIFIVSTQ